MPTSAFTRSDSREDRTNLTPTAISDFRKPKMDVKKIRNMEEFAAVVGVSRPTVSKYFNDPHSVRKSTRNRIEAALEHHDYRPNIFAINQNRRLTKNVGIVVPYLADPTFGEIARIAERRCIEAGFRATLFSAHGERDRECEILDNLRSLRPSGVLLAPLGRLSDQDQIARFCDEVPTVLLDRNMAGVGAAFVGSDNRSFRLAERRVSHSHRESRPAFSK